MNLETLFENSQVFLLVFVRIVAIVSIAPLLSSQAIPQLARIALCFFTAFGLLPAVLNLNWVLPETGAGFFFLLIGEAIIGILIGFILVITYQAFLLSGQFFSTQMGFAASEVFDPLSEIQIPLMGQFLNMIAMFVFIVISGFQKVFLIGILGSIESVSAVSLISQQEAVTSLILHTTSMLFQNSLLVAFPIVGTLFLVSLSMGLLAKAAPQMNLLMLGFPIAIFVGFTVLYFSAPNIMAAFGRMIDAGFDTLIEFFLEFRGASV